MRFIRSLCPLFRYYGALLSFASVGQLAPSPPPPTGKKKEEYTAFRSVAATAGATAMYMWDTGYAADVWALLDPASVKDVGSLFLQTDLSNNNVLDMYVTEKEK